MNDFKSLRVQSVLYRNSFDELVRAFGAVTNSLSNASHLLESWVVVFGDSSEDRVLTFEQVDSFERIAERLGGKFAYEFFGQNRGHGGGHNHLQENAEEELLLILNPDGILAPDTITRMILDFSPDTGVLDARQIPMEHPKTYDPITGEASWSSLACAMTSRSVFESVGGIDHETFFMYCDDVDYSWRVRLKGLKARYCPQARMFHDKRLDAEGNFCAGETEKYFSAEAALLLAYKYSRNDVLNALRKGMAESFDSNAKRALREFESRKVAGRLPAQIDLAHEVAEFTEGTYGSHRF